MSNATQRLEEIAERLKDKSLGLDQALSLLEEAQQLADEACEQFEEQFRASAVVDGAAAQHANERDNAPAAQHANEPADEHAAEAATDVPAGESPETPTDERASEPADGRAAEGTNERGEHPSKEVS